MDINFVSMLVSGAGLFITCGVILVSIGRAQRASEAKAKEAATHAERVALAQARNTEQAMLSKLEDVHGKLTADIHSMREKFSVELAVLKRDLDAGREEFKILRDADKAQDTRQREFENKVDARLRTVEIDLAVWKKQTGNIGPSKAQ